MGGLMSRNKGKRAEREVINALQPAVNSVYAELQQQFGWFRNEPPVLQRNTLQSHLGGFDVVGLEWLALEVKHHAKVTGMLGMWWRQCVEQAQAARGEQRLPVLVYRGNNEPWRVRMPAQVATGYIDNNGKDYCVPIVVDVVFDEWVKYFKAKVYSEAAASAYRLLQSKSPTRSYQ